MSSSMADTSNSRTTGLPKLNLTSDMLRYLFTHVFLPVQLPETSDYTIERDRSLFHVVSTTLQAYDARVRGTSDNGLSSQSSGRQWGCITKMLDNLQVSKSLDRGLIVSRLCRMQTGDVLAFLIRSHNCAIILTKRETYVLLESFQASPDKDAAENAPGPLACSYPEFAVEIPIDVFRNDDFQTKLANVLLDPNDSDGISRLPRSTYDEYVASLQHDVLQGDCRTAGVPLSRISKHVRDEAGKSWRRSSLWLFIRVAIQMSLDRSLSSRAWYKTFILFFICSIASDTKVTTLSSDRLYFMECKIFQRLNKLGSSTPKFLSRIALETCCHLRDLRDARLKPPLVCSSPFRNPSQDELGRDTQLSMRHSHKFIRTALKNRNRKPICNPFHPNRYLHGTINDFLSSNGTFFNQAYECDPDGALHDVSHSVEEGIDDWISCVSNVDDACGHIEILMDQYVKRAVQRYGLHPEDRSVMLQTGIELFAALDKLVVREIPMLADYSPEILSTDLEKLVLRGRTRLHRLSCVYQYLAERQSRSRAGWSVLSDEFTQDSFPVRYYDHSPHLQQLKVCIEANCSESPLPASCLHAKVVVFELQCPAVIRIWRSAVARIVNVIYQFDSSSDPTTEENLLSHASALQSYFVGGPPVCVKICFAYYFHSEMSQRRCTPRFHYVLHCDQKLFRWHTTKLAFDVPYNTMPASCISCRSLETYVHNVSHSPNDVLAAQARCPSNLSLDEFITFGQLRCGGLLQWANILQGLRSKTLNLRRCHVHFILSNAISQVGPLELSAGRWIWHRDLEDASLCNALLDELQDSFMDAVAGSIDGMTMSNISLLLTRVLASSPSEDVSKRVIVLLGNIRKKTFNWVQELSYNLLRSMEGNRRELLLEMAATCRSTFDVDSAMLHRLFHSAEDVDAAISSVLFVRAFSPSDIYDSDFSGAMTFFAVDGRFMVLLLQRERRLSLSLSRVLKDVISSDPSDYGVDLAVCKIFHSHKPSAVQWVPLEASNIPWLICQTRDTMDHSSKTLHLNLFDGELRVDGQPLGGLLRAMNDDTACQQIFKDQCFFIVPSDLPGMDFTTLSVGSEHKVHFSLRGGHLVVRAHHAYSKDVLLLIPASKLRKDLPSVLVDGQVHWLNLSTRVIEIRPLDRLWEQSQENWRIECASGQYRACKGREILVDFQSPTGEMVFQCFKFLSYHLKLPNSLLVTASPMDSASMLRLSVVLPYYGLLFSVNDHGDLESHDFKDMVYDEDQSIGALYGLQNLLVFRHKNHLAEGLISRCALVPNGIPQKRRDGQVFVYEPRIQAQLYYIYGVDVDLGCLTGSCTPTSTRYLAYLHAMTSQEKPDPLTGKTGNQTGCLLLQSAGCRSIMRSKALDNISNSWTNTVDNLQMNALHTEVEKRYHWNLKSGQNYFRKSREAQRAACLFTWHTMRVTTPELSPVTPTLDWLLSNRLAPSLSSGGRLSFDHQETMLSRTSDLAELNQLFSRLSSSQCNSFQQEYIAHIRASAHCSGGGSPAPMPITKDCIAVLETRFLQCRSSYVDALGVLKKTLSPSSEWHERTLHHLGRWPLITADVLLGCLASTSPVQVPAAWKECLKSFALLLLRLQRARRLLRFALDNSQEEFSKELENEGCYGWDSESHPDWLLIQIQGNFLIRDVQVEIAKEMIAPTSGKSTVMQVNMGEGKSSVIIPIVAAVLSDGKQLTRVIVPKAMAAHMFDLLVSRLGGLANRPVYHLPFARFSVHKNDGSTICLQMQDVMRQCMAERGILLVHPENVESMKLMSVEKQLCKANIIPAFPPKWQATSIYKRVTSLLPTRSLMPEESFVGKMFRWLREPENYSSKKNAVLEDSDPSCNANSASSWLSLQTWINSHVRDILDESDEILHPRFQLIYTLGLEQHMDGYPVRWTMIQQVLQLVKKHIHSSCQHQAVIQHQMGGCATFPHNPIDRTSDIGINLISWIIEDVMAGELPSLTFQDETPGLRDAIRAFISDPDIFQIPETAKRVEDYAKRPNESYLWNALLLLRGLLACRILWFALVEKRWRIDYGLIRQSEYYPSSDHWHSESNIPTMLAVPYHAKGVPTLNTQFSHPDTTIILTCLSYYYGGLPQAQLRRTFEIMLKEDDPTTEYALWVENYDEKTLPDSLRTLGEINLKPSEQWESVIFPLFSRNQAVINFFLSRVVFPREAKEFPWKLCATSWDLAEKREKVITGFSGSNDNRWLLPLSIGTRDLNNQRGSDAKVLAYLLRPENNSYMLMTAPKDLKRTTTHRLLETIVQQRPEIRVLLDVGAQLLDLSNREVAYAWLDVARNAAGAIYFNSRHELMVLTRDGITMSMLSSPLSQQLHRCVVYLDHVHTRGTDIQFPLGSRAAVTLSLKLTKDRLVQGCMRMRKLGRGHSVMFFAPPEVDLSIRLLAGKMDSNDPVYTVDILCWAIHETWADIRQRAPYWAQQGINHQLRYDTWARYCKDKITAKELVDAWLQPERKSLEDLYVPRPPGDEHVLNTSLALFHEISQRCKNIGILSHPNIQMDEEQEREVNREHEREREVELPPEAEPVEHSLHPDIVSFVKSGLIPRTHAYSAFQPVFTTLTKSSAVTCDADVWSPFIFATADFCSTIRPESTRGTQDQYLRPVQWVLSTKRGLDQVLVLISPFEADRLLPDIRDSKHVHLHMYAPRKFGRMRPCDDLKSYSIPSLPPDWTPPWGLIDQLNVFAGQLYLRNYDAYIRLCHFLDIPTDDKGDNTAVRWNKRHVPGDFEADEVNFSGSPLPFFMALLSIRNRGWPFEHTHMGKIHRGQPLRKKDFVSETQPHHL